jgi:hypothetical protein
VGDAGESTLQLVPVEQHLVTPTPHLPALLIRYHVYHPRGPAVHPRPQLPQQ